MSRGDWFLIVLWVLVVLGLLLYTINVDQVWYR